MGASASSARPPGLRSDWARSERERFAGSRQHDGALVRSKQSFPELFFDALDATREGRGLFGEPWHAREMQAVGQMEDGGARRVALVKCDSQL